MINDQTGRSGNWSVPSDLHVHSPPPLSQKATPVTNTLEDNATSDPSAMLQLLDLASVLKPMALRVAATLNIADYLADGPKTITELAEATHTSEPHLRKLMSYLAELEVFVENGLGQFDNTSLSEPLLSTSAFSIRRILDVNGGVGRSQLGLVGLLHTISTGETCHSSVFGSRYWDELNNDPKYLESLRSDGNRGPVYGAEEIIHGYDWSEVRTVIDIGGNNGMVLINLLQAHGHLTGATLDLPNLASIAGDEIAAAGLTERAESISGSFFESLPSGYDVYLLSGILNDWTDAEATQILTNVAAAAGPTARILLGEINLRYEMMSPNVAELDLYMSTLVPAPVRTLEDIERIAAPAQLNAELVKDDHPFRTLIELTPIAPGPAA